ncbi:hypothetical protein Tco_1104256 [Tanacetum coccineum]
MYKRKFVIVCYEKVVRIPLEGDEILQVHGELTQGVMKSLMNTKVEFRIDLVHGATCKTRVLYDLVIFCGDAPVSFVKKEEHGVHLKLELELLRTEKLYAKIVNTILPLTERIEKGRVKLRRVRMSMTIQSSVKDKIFATSSESSKYEYEIHYHPGKANVVTGALSRKERVGPRRVRAMAAQVRVLSSEVTREQASCVRLTYRKEGGRKLRWMIYLVVLADAAESVRDTIGFDYHSSIWCAPFEALYGMKCSNVKKKKLKAVRDRQKSCADNRRKPLEFEVGERVMLKVSPWKGVIRFGKKGKLAPSLHVPLDEIKVDKTLRFVEEPVENSDREVKRLKCSRMVVVKVHLGSKRGL